jgi:hypothetical protein
VCENHTLLVKSHIADGNCRSVEITLVRVEVTLVRFEITLERVLIADLFFAFLGGGELITPITPPWIRACASYYRCC